MVVSLHLRRSPLTRWLSFLSRLARADARAQLTALLAGVFIAAQLIFAAHAAAQADDFIDHSPSSCIACLAGAASDDPTLLVFALDRPALLLADIEPPVLRAAIVAPLVRAADARAPPSC